MADPVLGSYGYWPYCGAPPRPETLAARWNLDPVLLTCLVGLLVAYVVAIRLNSTRAAREQAWRPFAFYAAWSLGALALVSPLCPLSVSLFSARVGQHMILTTIVAPLAAAGCRNLFSFAAGRPLAAAASFAALLWFWHAPGPYAWTFENDLAYWLMHVSLFGAALWFWVAALGAAEHRLGGFVAAMTATAIQMGMLGALITFASRPLYAPHALTTVAWGLTPLQDQQLGGVIMWVPAGAIFVVGLVGALGGAMRRGEALSLARAAAR